MTICGQICLRMILGIGRKCLGGHYEQILSACSFYLIWQKKLTTLTFDSFITMEQHNMDIQIFKWIVALVTLVGQVWVKKFDMSVSFAFINELLLTMGTFVWFLSKVCHCMIPYIYFGFTCHVTVFAFIGFFFFHLTWSNVWKIILGCHSLLPDQWRLAYTTLISVTKYR